MRRIVAAVRQSDVSEFELAHGEFRVRVRRGAAAATAPLASASATSTPDSPEERLHRITAPLTGVFYRAASPAGRPYVNEGDWVDAETVIGLVETMKIFNEVTADRAGRLVAFLVDSGQLVQTGQLLATLEPAERTAAAPESRP